MPIVPAFEIARAQAALAAASFPKDTPTLPELARVARQLGRPWGLNGKRGDPKDPSRDILGYAFGGAAQPQLFDVLIDAWDPESGKGKNLVTWQALEYPQAFGAVWIDPETLDAAPVPGPVPTPPAHRFPSDWVSAEHWQNVEAPMIYSDYFAAHGTEMAPSDWAFQAYRRLGPERWTMADILEDL